MLVLRCTVTGRVVAAEYDPASNAFGYEEAPDRENIPTVLFNYTPETGEFDFIRLELQSAVDEARQCLPASEEIDEDLMILVSCRSM